MWRTIFVSGPAAIASVACCATLSGSFALFAGLGWAEPFFPTAPGKDVQGFFLKMKDKNKM